MNHKAASERTAKARLVVAPASTSTWVVAVSRHLIPGACFTTRSAAIDYAAMLATAAGIRRENIMVLGA
jgi:hypothetical protein